MGKTVLKAVPNKIRFADYLKDSGLSQFNSAIHKTVCAYSDCLPENVDTTGIERDLDHFSVEAMSLDTARKVMAAACPDGYNGFSVEAFDKIAQVFGDDCLIHLARESSVCLYIKPVKSGHVWFDRKCNAFSISDEFSYEPSLSMFRLWWD